jgi:hypothetical protein
MDLSNFRLWEFPRNNSLAIVDPIKEKNHMKTKTSQSGSIFEFTLI